VNRNLTIRLLLASLVIAAGLVIFSFTYIRASHSDNPATNGEGKCEDSKSQSPFVLWESLTHNLLISKR
jgi:hypothetical protein